MLLWTQLRPGRKRILIIRSEWSIKSLLNLESNQQFINILLKARSGSDESPAGAPGEDGPPPGADGPDGPPPGMTPEIMEKMSCNMVIYQILAKDNAKEYPLQDDDKPISKYSSTDGACTYDATVKSCSQSDCSESTMEQTMPNCDCSDPKKYNFHDKGRFKI